jgi:DNA-directed RNA polymerase specialized sigma24 family protein
VLLTATGTAGGLSFAAWAGLDRLFGGRAQDALATRLAVWKALSELPAHQRAVIERAYFGGLSYIQIGRAFGVPSAA